MANGNDKNEFVDLFAIPIFGGALIGLLYFFYYLNKIAVNEVVITSAYWVNYPLSFFLDSRERAMEQLSNLNVEAIELNNLFEILNYTNSYFSWILIPLAIYLSHKIISNEIQEKYKRDFKIDTLIDNNAEILPFLRPISTRERSIVEESVIEGGWALPVKPIQWVQKNNLLIDKEGNPFPKKMILSSNGMPHVSPDKTKLLSQSKKVRKSLGARIDEEKVKALFLEQLGEKLETDRTKIADSLKDYEAGIVASLIAYGLGDKKKGYNYISIMSDSFVEGEWDEKTKTASDYELDIGDAREYIKKNLTAEEVDETLELTFKLHGAYKYTWIMSLLEDFASQKCVFNSALYIFLRPTDNKFFLTLNQVGSSCGWIEALGIWTHYEMEKVSRYNIVDNTYSLELAVKYLNVYLENDGWIGYESDVYQ